MKSLISVLLVVGLCACVATYPSVNQIDSYESSDQEILYGMIRTLQSSLNSRDVDKWFALYSDDAIITYTKNRPTPKKEVVASVQEQDPSSWTFKIEDIKIVETKIEPETAQIKTILKMNTGSAVKDHPETYYFSKSSGTWLIVKETNP